MSKTIKTLTSAKRDFPIGDKPSVSLEELQTSAMLRIADAAELMAKNLMELQEKYLYQKERADRYNLKILELERSNAAYRGHMTRLKNKIQSPETPETEP